MFGVQGQCGPDELRGEGSGDLIRSHAWNMMEPFGFAMPMGRVVGRLLTTAAETVQKCAVLPESAIAVTSGGMMVGGDLW